MVQKTMKVYNIVTVDETCTCTYTFDMCRIYTVDVLMGSSICTYQYAL